MKKIEAVFKWIIHFFYVIISKLWKVLKFISKYLWKCTKLISKCLYKAIKSICFFILPFIPTIYANIKINRELKKENIDLRLDEDYALINIELDNLRTHYDKTFETKNSLESKAQNGIFSLTIVITLIFSIMGLKKDFFTEDLPQCIKYLAIALAVVMLIYFLISGFINLYLLIGKNEMSFLTWQGECYNWESEESKKEYICEAIERNIMRNQIRHNSINCAYRCVIMGILLLISLFIIFFIF